LETSPIKEPDAPHATFAWRWNSFFNRTRETELLPKSGGNVNRDFSTGLSAANIPDFVNSKVDLVVRPAWRTYITTYDIRE
jgi:hypothetical protein